MIKRIISILLIIFMLTAVIPSATLAVEKKHPFTDVPEWATEYVNIVYENGTMNGIGGNLFGSDQPLTREQLVVTLYRLSGAEVEGTFASLKHIFEDASDISDWAYDAVQWAISEEITAGIREDQKLYFKPKNVVTRQEAAKFLVTFIDSLRLNAPTDNVAQIKDMDKIGDWALPYVEKCIAAGIVSGDGEGNFDPTGKTIRIAAAKMLACLPTEKIPIKYVAHQGLSSAEKGNTCAAFIAAGQKNYYGIESDVRMTKDGKFVMIHDNSTSAATDGKIDISVSESTWDELSKVVLSDLDGSFDREELKIPMMSEYINICKEYGKEAILELKPAFAKEDIQRMIDEIESLGYLENVTFISFNLNNCIRIREILPDAEIQLLWEERVDDGLIESLKEHNLDLALRYRSATRVSIQLVKEMGITINCWTCDSDEWAERLTSWGVDTITTNVLEWR